MVNFHWITILQSEKRNVYIPQQFTAEMDLQAILEPKH